MEREKEEEVGVERKKFASLFGKKRPSHRHFVSLSLSFSFPLSFRSLFFLLTHTQGDGHGHGRGQAP